MKHSRATLLFTSILPILASLGCGGSFASGGEVASTSHPLVAQYTITNPHDGLSSWVEFGTDTNYGRKTSVVPGNEVSIILVAGMKFNTTYHMRAHVTWTGGSWVDQDHTFTTGGPPSSPAFPAVTVSRPDPSTASPENPGIEMIDGSAPTSNLMQAFFTDRDGNPIWYYDVGKGNWPFSYKLLPNGHFVFFIILPPPGVSILREVDLTGATVREMNANQLNAKMLAAGFDFAPTFFHHDMYPLANGHLIVLTNFIKQFTDLPGYPGTMGVIGDGLIDLDENWNPVWAWNSFDYLDVNRHLNGLPDWLHGNAVVYTQQDGNLLFSMRHQSWVVKIDYSDGLGTGKILWRLGYQGDFTLAQGSDPSLWFSFQHFPSVVNQNGSHTTLAIWDNGDNRVLDTSGTICGTPTTPPCYSRATVYDLDESSMIANLAWADSLPYFSIWGGSMNQLENGNIEYDINSPLIPPSPGVASEVQEVTPTALPQTVWQMDIPDPVFAYRAYRWPSLYPGVTWPY